jgi:putative solute:sodium symporter small subunit
MAEIILGLVAILAAAAVASGLTDGLVPFPLGHGAIGTALLLAVILLLRGFYRLAKRRGHANPYELRSMGLAITIAGITIATVLVIPSLSETLNLVTVAGFPLGLYLMGQGTLVLFAALLFIYAVRQNRIDAGDP